MTTRPLLVVRRKESPTIETLCMPFSQRDRMVIRAFARQGNECPLLIYPCSERDGGEQRSGRGTRSKPVYWKFVRMPRSSSPQESATSSLEKDVISSREKDVAETHLKQPSSKQESGRTKKPPPQLTLKDTLKDVHSSPPVVHPHGSIPASCDSHKNFFTTFPINGNYGKFAETAALNIGSDYKKAAMGSQFAFSDQGNGVNFLPPTPAPDWSAVDPTTNYGGYPSPVYDPAFHHAWAIICSNASPSQPMSPWNMYGPTYIHSGSPHYGETSHTPPLNPYDSPHYKPWAEYDTYGHSGGQFLPEVMDVHNRQPGSKLPNSTTDPTVNAVSRNGWTAY